MDKDYIILETEFNKMEHIIITAAAAENISTIQQIGKETFHETFSQSNTKEDMQKYLDENFSEQKVKSELNNSESMFFIAWDESLPVGYLKLNIGAAQTEDQGHAALEIERIYVKSTHHGKKVGQMLYEQALVTAKQLKKDTIWLGVWEENPRAIRFYEKNGFVAFDRHIFKMGDNEQTDIMMRKTLTSAI